MTNMVVAELGRIPMSANLAATLSRATDYARAQQHVEVTLEHLLLALTEDPEAGLVLAASNLDVGRLSADVSSHLGRIEERMPPDRQGQLVVSPDLRRILEAAAAAAQQGRRREINGAIVLAAVVGDGRSTAAHLLSAHGLTFEGAIHALQRANAQTSTAQPPANQPSAQPPRAAEPPPQPAALQQPSPIPSPSPGPMPLPPRDGPPTGGRGASHPQPSMDDLLAEARERVRRRHAPVGDEQHTAEAAAPPVHEPMSSADVSVDYDDPAPAERYETTRAPSYAPDWREQPIHEDHGAQARVAERVEPAFPPLVTPPVLESPPPMPRPAPPPPGPSQPAQSYPAPPPGPPPRPSVHPHRPMPPDRGARPPQPPPPSPTSDAMNGSWVPPQQQGAPAGPRPMRQPPPLPPGLPPPPLQRGRPMPGSEEMSAELRRAQMQPPPAPQMPSPLPPPGAPQASAQGGGRPRTGPSPAVEIGQLVENIPKAMRVAVPQRVEVRIGKANVKALAEGLQGGGAAWRHDVMVTKAMSVRLRAPEGGFFIESASPETQWIENTLGLMSDDYASWRWTVTPRERGWKRLQLVVSARTVGGDGVAAETALPDQVIDVKVKTNYGRAAMTAGTWAAAAVVGGLLAKFGEGAFAVAYLAAKKAIGG